MDIIVDAIADYAMELSYDALPKPVVERVKHLIVDAFGCALGAGASQAAKIAATMAAKVQSKIPATVMLSGIRTSPDLAAFANGTLVRFLDYNDTYTGKGTVHPSDMLAAVLAAAECSDADGKAVILGTALGYEVLCNLTDSGAMQQKNGEASSWDQGTYGVISATAAAGKLMGLAREQIGHAISLAVSSHMAMIQIRHGQISQWKGCAVPNACRNAIFCAQLAAQGMTGPRHIFDGDYGFFRATGCAFDMLPFGSKGSDFRIMRARVKPYPAGYHGQSAIEAALQLRSQIPDLARVRKIHLETHAAGYRVMGSGESRWKPQTRETADHSLPFAMTMALMEGDLQVRHYDEERYKNVDVRAFMAKISVTVGEEPTHSWPDTSLSILRAELDDGREIKVRVSNHIGHYSRPMTQAQLETKFKALARHGAKLPDAQIDHLLAALWNLENANNLGELLRLTVV